VRVGTNRGEGAPWHSRRASIAVSESYYLLNLEFDSFT